MLRHIPARPEQSQSPLTVGDTVRTAHAGRVGTVTHVYPDGSASIRWHDEHSDATDLGHERMPRNLLIVIDVRAICNFESWRVIDDNGTDYFTFPTYAKAVRFAYALMECDRTPPISNVTIYRNTWAPADGEVGHG
ncbi:hypothetical protein [Burkholderia pseudomallei]|uniref:hypothetical protein n=1 Tax=Burkholderia pseudomallei TaxID=28450 RepID=UPI00052A51BC|nr:hypothetical protein [Burkholderia pseudomallei]AIV62916.1 hypothetical protein X993_449 [Burkholderia pseudomallei K42]